MTGGRKRKGENQAELKVEKGIPIYDDKGENQTVGVALIDIPEVPRKE